DRDAGHDDAGGSEAPDVAAADARLPRNAVWVFSGTSDGNALARELVHENWPVVVCAATEYGGDVARVHCEGATVWAGRQGAEARRRALLDSSARVIVDATHPYAQRISEQLIRFSQSTGIPYIRFERPSTLDSRDVILCESATDAAQRAIERGRRIFLST